MTFNPTHKFQGLELHYEYDYDVINGVMTSWYTAEDGSSLCLPQSQVTKFQPQPKTGEVWKYIGSHDEPYPLVLISSEIRSFVNEEGDTIRFVGSDHLSNFVKVLNADGTPA